MRRPADGMGNPYRVVRINATAWDVATEHHYFAQATAQEAARRVAVERYRVAQAVGWHGTPAADYIRANLRGRDLACWCPLDQPCHADVLL